MKRFTLLIVTILVSVNAIYSQTVHGHVYDNETHEPLIGVNISYNKPNGDTKGTSSDVSGAYTIEVPEGGVTLQFSYIGYENISMPLVISHNENKQCDIYMHTSSTILEDVVVSAGRFEQKLTDVTVSMELLKADDIARQAPTDLSSALNTLPGVDVNDKQPSIRGGNGWTYGVGTRSMIMIDGMSALTSGNGVINWNILPVENIQQVEVIKGASSVLYGSSALNGVIDIRTKRPELTPHTTVRAFVGIYGDARDGKYQWADKSFWKEGKYEVEPLMRRSILSGVRTPIYEGFDLTHSRRIGNLDLNVSANLFTDEGYKEQNYNKRFRIGGNLTYHQPTTNGKIINYGMNMNFLSDKYADFFIWRSPVEAYKPSAFANMGREGNTIYMDPFFNLTNTNKNTTHKVKARFYFRGDNIIQASSQKNALEILGNMGTNPQEIANFVQKIQNGDYNMQYLMNLLLQGGIEGVANEVTGILGQMFPTATTADYCDLIAWVMQNGIPKDQSEIIPWLSEAINGKDTQTNMDKNFTYYLDYQFGKKWDGGAQLTTGVTYEHMKSISKTTSTHDSDNAAFYMQYDQRFFDRLSVSAGMRAEYYRVDDYLKEAETKLFSTTIPVRPIFRAGLNYQLAEYSFLRASVGQGYRYPSLTEKYARKDIGGVGVYPNKELKAEKGLNVELGFKQGYKLGNLQGFFDAAGFFTQYDDMIEFRFGLFNNTTFEYTDNLMSIIGDLQKGEMPGIGAQFYNVSKARIYGVEIGTTGMYRFNDNANLTYNLGYIYINPQDVNYKDKNEKEESYTLLQMKEKSNNSKYLKYRQKHTFKTVLDFNWKRLSIGTNIMWKSKTLAVDYLMVDEREENSSILMEYLRDILFGNVDGQTLHSYWNEHNTGYCVVDVRAGVRITRHLSAQLMINNLLNTEYSTRPMAVAAPRTFVVQLKLDL